MGRPVMFIPLLIVAVLHGASPCGITTHLDISERASAFFNEVSRDGVNYAELIRRHQDAFQASTSYPDAFYPGICGGGQYHDVSEDTHWTPFLEAAVKYIRDTYPPPWTERAEKLVVFLLGVVQHQVADVTWHNLAGIREGFLDVMGKTNFHGSFNDAHSHGDFGGDVVNIVELKTDYIKTIGTWYIPVEDLAGIYRVLYDNEERIPDNIIVQCNILMYLGRLGEKLGAINLVYPLYTMQSPFLLDRLQDYFLGGMDDMAAWTAHVWKHTVDMLDEGTEICQLPENPVYITCNGNANLIQMTPPRSPQISGWHHPDTLYKMMGNLTLEDAVVETVEGGVVIHATERLQSILNHTVDDAASMIQNASSTRMRRAQPKWSSLVGATLSNLSQTSMMMAREVDDDEGVSDIQDFLDKIVDILRKVIEIYQNRDDGVAPVVPAGSFRTDDEYARLGESLLSFDLNGDGYDDLVLGAPLHGQPGNPMAGRVYVKYGSAGDMVSGNQSISEEADVIFESETPNSRFGTALAAIDMNADGYPDLAISAPMEGSQNLEYKGAVYIYYGQADGTLNMQHGMKLTCTKFHCNMGWSLAGSDVDNDGVRDLLIGCPFATAGGSQRGVVGVFHGKRSFKYVEELSDEEFEWEYYGEQDWSWFGFSIAAAADFVAIGAPQHRICSQSGCPFRQDDTQAAGQVYVFRTPLRHSSPDEEILAGEDEFGQFGYSLALSEGGRMLAIGAPTENQGGLLLGKFQEGRVYLYETGGNYRRAQATLKGERMVGRFGQTLLIRDVNDDDIDDVIVGAPLYNGNVWEEAQQGRVYIYHGTNADSAVSGIRNSKASDADVALTEGEGRSRFGAALVAVGGNDKQVSLVVSSMHSNEVTRLAGKVSLFDMA